MTEVISVRFRGGCKTYYFDPRENQVKMGDEVIVETAQGPEFATCTEGNHQVAEESIVKPLSSVLRMATDNDRRTVEYNRKREKEAFGICEKKIAAHGLEMKLVNISCSFDGSKIIFFFTADGRVDFRELVRDLASVFRARIELRQIGVRDEAKMIGGLGICGRPFCCSQFLDGFMPVSIKMAKTQSLSLNPTKISGTCGRLMCCLKYEQNAYEDAAKRMPKNESFVQTPDGPGNVKSVDLLQEKVKVSLDGAQDGLKCYHNCELCVLRNGKGSREGIVVPEERPARYVDPKKKEEAGAGMIPPFYMKEAEQTAQPEGVSEEEQARRRRRSRGRRSGGGNGPRSEGGQPSQGNRGGAARQEGGNAPSRSGEDGSGQRQQSRRPSGPRPANGGGNNRPKGDGGNAGRPAAPNRSGAAADGEGQARRRPHHRGGRRRRPGEGGGNGPANGGGSPSGPSGE